MSNIRKIPISTGVYWVEIRHADVRILCGCPEDAVKHLLRKGLIVPMEVGVTSIASSVPVICSPRILLPVRFGPE